MTAFYGVFDRRTRVLRYANAGHPYPLRWEAATGVVKPLAAHGFRVAPDRRSRCAASRREREHDGERQIDRERAPHDGSSSWGTRRPRVGMIAPPHAAASAT